MKRTELRRPKDTVMWAHIEIVGVPIQKRKRLRRGEFLVAIMDENFPD